MSISLRTGGVERQYVRLANQMAAMGHDVDLLLCVKDGPFLDLLSPKIRIVEFKTEVPRKSIPGIADYLRAEQPEGLLGGHDAINIAVVEAKRRAKVKSRAVFCAHSTMSLRYGREHRDLRSRLRGYAVKVSARRADCVGAVSGQSADDLARWARVDRAKIKVPYLPIVSKELHEQAAKPPSHKWLLQKDEPTIITVGRLIDLKQLDLLMAAFVPLKDRARLINFGEGPELERLLGVRHDLGLDDRVDFPGLTSNPVAEMAAADMMVLSSRMEGLPSILIEGLAVGVPMVSSDCTSGPREILEGGKWGRLFPVGDQQALTAAMQDTLDRPIKPLPESCIRFTAEESTRRYLEMITGQVTP